MNRYAKQCVSRSRQAKRGRNQLNIHSPDVEEMLDRSSLMRMTVINGTIIRLVLMLTNWIYVQSSKTPRPYLHMPSKPREDIHSSVARGLREALFDEADDTERPSPLL